MKQFNTYELNLLTQCNDERDKFVVNINPETKEVTIIDLASNNVIKHLGYNSTLSEKLLSMIEVKITNRVISSKNINYIAQ